MRLAAISDIHGNLPALEAVLDDIARAGVDMIVNLGDILSGPLWVSETADRLMAMQLPTIAGNHERQVLTLPLDRMGASDAFTAPRLSAAQRDWLAALPPTLALGEDILLVHGSPRGDLEPFVETVTGGEPGIRAATEAEAAERARGVTQRLILCGHTHLPRAMTLRDGRLIVNAGSVGLQAFDDDHPLPYVAENHTPHARYVVLSRAGAGWSVEHRAVPYDHESAARLAEANGRGDWADALRTGRVGRREARGAGVNPWVGGILCALAIAVGWTFWRWQGLVLAATIITFWFLLQFNRAVRVMRSATAAPVGHVASAVMMNAKLHPGMTMLQVVTLTRSLGERAGEGEDHWRWQDPGGSVVTLNFRRGRLQDWHLERPPAS